MIKYKYTVTDLDGNPVLVATSMPKIARLMGISESTVENRVKRRITKYDSVRWKYNITRKELNGNNR